MDQGLGVIAGSVLVATTTGRGHTPEFHAERMCARLIQIAESTPPPIRDQALAFQDAIRVLMLDGVRRAILSDRTTILARLRQAGMVEAATLVHSMEV